MKGQYAGRKYGESEGGERVLLWATVVKAHDASNHVVQCAGETFTPSAEAMSAAEPTALELSVAAGKMAAWERQEAARLQAAEVAAQVQAVADAQAADAKALVGASVSADAIKAAVTAGVVEGIREAEAARTKPQSP